MAHVNAFWGVSEPRDYPNIPARVLASVYRIHDWEVVHYEDGHYTVMSPGRSTGLTISDD